MFNVVRNPNNPILSPSQNTWESLAVFNGCPIKEHDKGETITMLYRAMSLPDPYEAHHASLSIIGKATSQDGNFFEHRKQFIVPDTEYDAYGCEDPRVTFINNKYYTFYTALGAYPYTGETIRVGLAISKDLEKIDEKHLITPFNAKAMMLFPEKINGKFVALVSVNPDVKPIEACVIEFTKEEDIWDETYWKEWYKNRTKWTLSSLKRKDTDHIELGAPPIKTEKGWLIIYSHIQRYETPDVVFGIEAALLDLNDPTKIIANTQGPFLVPETFYEKIGQIPNIVFPTGALIDGNILTVYYGGADTHIATIDLPLDRLFDAMFGKKLFTRAKENPIISPRHDTAWEKGGTLNPAVLLLQGKTHLLYRAATEKNVSTFGYAVSEDGIIITNRPDQPVYLPRSPIEKGSGDANYGCEDPRLIQIGSTIYMLYTAYNGQNPRVAVTTISEKDFIDNRWNMWSTPIAITREGIDEKDAIFLPEKLDKGYFFIHRVSPSICGDWLSSLDFQKEKIEKCIELVDPRYGMWDSIKVGISTPAIKTEKGWLVLYHGISWSKVYRVGALLLDLHDPTIVLGRSTHPILEPEEYYEKKGVVGNVVFPCGVVVRDDTLYLYYGAADTTVGVATCSLKELLHTLTF